MAKLDKKTLSRNALLLKEVESAALKLAEEKLEIEKDSFVQEFSLHPVTLELEAGEASRNTSGTLGGYGNLFSFIGFKSGDQPTSIVKQMIGRIRLYGKKTVKTKDQVVSFPVIIPSFSDFESKTPMPWATSRSWLSGIERGISGFGYFISRKLSGRSLGGIQTDDKIRPGSFRNVSYFSKMYNSFMRRLRTDN